MTAFNKLDHSSLLFYKNIFSISVLSLGDMEHLILSLRDPTL